MIRTLMSVKISMMLSLRTIVDDTRETQDEDG